MRYLLFISLFMTVNLSGQVASFDTSFLHYQIVSWDSYSNRSTIQRGTDDFYNIELNGWVLTVAEFPTIDPDYQSKSATQPGNQGVPFDVITLKGSSPSGGGVSITIGNGFLQGRININDEIYIVEPLIYYDSAASIDDYILYRHKDFINHDDGECGIQSKEENVSNEHDHQQVESGLCYNIEYGIVHDYTMYQKYGSVALAEAHAIAVTNDVNGNYDDEFSDEVVFTITGQYVVDCLNCEPWNILTDPSDMLDEFSGWASIYLGANPINIQHDVASLWTDIDLDGSVIGVAYLGGMCQSTRYNVLQDFNGTPNQKRVLVAHELGHNLNAFHDSRYSNYIMTPTIKDTDVWSQKSLTTISTFFGQAPCLEICDGITPQVKFLKSEISIMESGTQLEGFCGQSMISINPKVKLSHILGDSVVATIQVDPSSTAHPGIDFLLKNDTLVFYDQGSLTKSIQLEIMDDAILEEDEYIILTLTILEGNAVEGTNNQLEITIHNVGDDFNEDCCGSGNVITYGQQDYYFNGIFYGTQDARSRTLLRAEDLQSMGLASGYIDRLSIFVVNKTSTGPYQNFTIGMRQINLVEMNHSWYSTTEVYNGDFSTSANQWNHFEFYRPFYWDGSSDLYVHFCFDNDESVGRDYIMGWDASNAGYDLFSFAADNYASGCSLNTGSYFYNPDRNPYLLIRTATSPQWEVNHSELISTSIKAGDTAHIYSENDRIIATIKNIGKDNLECVSVEVVEQGHGSIALPSSIYKYSDKNIWVSTPNDKAYYEVDLYYTQEEMMVWQSSLDQINIIQSPVPFSISDSLDRTIHGVYKIKSKEGNGNDFITSTTLTGSGYLALTDQPEHQNHLVVNGGNYVINEPSGKLVMTNQYGNSYMISPDNNSINSTPYDQSLNGNSLYHGDMYLTHNNSNLYFKNSMGDYSRMMLGTSGEITLQNGITDIGSHISLPIGNVALMTPGCGVVFKNTNNDCRKLVMGKDGIPFTIKVKCYANSE